MYLFLVCDINVFNHKNIQMNANGIQRIFENHCTIQMYATFIIEYKLI